MQQKPPTREELSKLLIETWMHLEQVLSGLRDVAPAESERRSKLRKKLGCKPIIT